MTDNRIRLFCVVDRDTSTKAFPVKIEPTETIGELKDAVKTALSRHFNDIDANELILWNFSIPDDGLTVQLNSLRKSNDEQLKGTSTLRDVFGPEKNNKTIRVIVERPPPEKVLETEEDWVEAFTKIESEFFASAQVNNLHRFVVGPATVPTTSGRLGGLPLIPTRAASNVGLEGRPSLLFLNLPESSAPLDSLSTASKALSKIDSRSVPLMPFFGVSGCGKTRTAIEMLSKRWGFYFNANDADLGSMDLINLVRRLQAKKQRSNEERTLVQILALVLVLSRIMTLEHCLDVAQRERTTFTCKHWMLLQVGFGSMGILDLFANLSGSIASKIQQHSMQIWTMSAIVQNRFSKLQQRLKDGAALPPKILLVIDEAQNLTMDEFRVFGSQFLEDNAASAGKQSLPILSPLIHGLYLIAHDHNMFSVIPCGTGLSLFDMKWLEDSAPAAKGHGTARFTDFRGWESLEQVREYRNSVRDSLPNLRARTIFDSQVPDAPVPMLFQRLRGRYRPIVSAIERMVKSDSGEINWEMAIEEIVNNLTMPELDVKGNVCHDLQKMISKVAAFPKQYNKYQDIRDTLKIFVVQHYLFGSPLLLNKEEAPLVEASVGRILDVGAKKETVVNEPFVLLAAKNYFHEYDKNFHSLLRRWFSASRKPSVPGHIWEPAMLPSLVNAFNRKILSETPLVPEGKSHDLILDMESRIVGYEEHVTLGVDYVSMPSLDTFLTAHVQGNSRCNGNEVAPFYFPLEKTSGPDIVFVLRFRDLEGQDLGCCPVFVQAKLRMKMALGETREAFSTVKSDAVERLLEEKLEKYCTVSPKRFFGVVVAYPAELAGSEGLFPTIRPITRNLSAQAKGEKLSCISLRIDKTNIHGLFLKRHMEALSYLKKIEHDSSGSSSQSSSSQSSSSQCSSSQDSDEGHATKQRRLDDVIQMELD